MSDIEYVSIDKAELKRLQADSACLVIAREALDYASKEAAYGIKHARSLIQACAALGRIAGKTGAKLTAIAQAGRAPEGFVLVPVEPTPAMLKATENIEIGAADWRGDKDIIEDYEAREVYLAMIAAAQGDSHE